MTAPTLLDALGTAGFTLAVHNDDLRIRGPAGAITPALTQAVKLHKPALLALLAERESASAQEDIAREGRGEVSPAQLARASALWGPLGWRDEWLIELGTTVLRLRGCTDPEVLLRLQPIVMATPQTASEWLALGARLTQAELELGQLGKLPPLP